MAEFDLVMSLLGGVLIGLAAVLLMFLHGRIAGVSGILSGALFPGDFDDRAWRFAFLVGAMTAPALLMGSSGYVVGFQNSMPLPWLVAAGFIAGIGVTLGSGCTSGHGVCGNARFSVRSIVATLIFMITAAVAVFATRHIIGA